MEEKSYRLAEYQITLRGGEIWWKTHGGFGNTKSGKCFIEGDVLFIGPCETDEIGFLKTEFLQYLKKFPQWDGTKYYCPSYTLYSCKGHRARTGGQHPETKGAGRRDRAAESISHVHHHSKVVHPFGERNPQHSFDSLSSVPEKQEKITESEPPPEESPPVESKEGMTLRSLSSAAGIEQLKGKWEKALSRCKGLVGFSTEKKHLNE